MTEPENNPDSEGSPRSDRNSYPPPPAGEGVAVRGTIRVSDRPPAASEGGLELEIGEELGEEADDAPELSTDELSEEDALEIDLIDDGDEAAASEGGEGAQGDPSDPQPEVADEAAGEGAPAEARQEGASVEDSVRVDDPGGPPEAAVEEPADEAETIPDEPSIEEAVVEREERAQEAPAAVEPLADEPAEGAPASEVEAAEAAEAPAKADAEAPGEEAEEDLEIEEEVEAAEAPAKADAEAPGEEAGEDLEIEEEVEAAEAPAKADAEAPGEEAGEDLEIEEEVEAAEAPAKADAEAPGEEAEEDLEIEEVEEEDPEALELQEVDPEEEEGTSPPPVPDEDPQAEPREAAAPEPPATEPAPDAPRPRKRKRPWFETFFNDDYLRTVPPPTQKQIARQVDFIEQVLGLERGATILDVGCGLGMHAIELTKRGYLVVGLDLSLPMLSRAGDEAQDMGLKINFLHGDMRDMVFEGSFDAVLCWSTTFGYFDDEANRKVMGRLYKALKPRGLLLLDVVNRDFVVPMQPNLIWFEGDGCVCMEETSFNYITSRLEVKRTVILDDGRQREAQYSIRLYSIHELGQLMHQQGFRVAEISGGEATRGVFLGSSSPRLIILAERRLRPSSPPSGIMAAPQSEASMPPPPPEPREASGEESEPEERKPDEPEPDAENGEPDQQG